MVAELGRGYDAPWDWRENGADALAWKRVEDDYNLLKGLTTQEYMDEFYRRDQAGWTTFQTATTHLYQ